MRSSFVFLFAVSFSCLLVANAAPSALSVVSSDASGSAVYPLTLTKQGGAAQTIAYSATATTVTDAPTTASPAGNVYTARWTGGVPLNQVYTLTVDSTPTATGIVVNVALGPQVSLRVVASGAATTSNAGSAQTSAALVVPSINQCGSYFVDCIAGTLSVSLYTPATASANCVVTIDQVAAITGILQYPTATAPTSPYAAVTSAVTTANAAPSAATIICGTGTSGANTWLYFISTFGSANTQTAQTTAFNGVRTAAAAGNIAGNTAFSVANLQPSNTATLTAPSAASLTNRSSSSTKTMIAAGLLTTAFATLFGLAL